MLPLIPILLIAKLTMVVSAGKGKMNKAQLDEYLLTIMQQRDFALPDLLQHEVGFAAGLLLSVHSALVLLEASTRDFDPPNNLMEVSSFKPDIVDKDQNDQVVGGSIKESTTIIPRVINAVPDFAEIPKICKKNYGNNLKVCFDQAKDLPDGFDIDDCLRICFNSAQNDVKRKNFLEGALLLIRRILLTADLKQVAMWLQSGPPDPVANTSDWLEKQLGLDTLKTQLNTQSNNLSDEVKLNLSRIKVMIDQDGDFFVETLQRLDFGSDEKDDIKEAVTAILFPGPNEPSHLPPEQQKAWTNMQQALYGAVGWHIFRQAQLATQRTRISLEQH